MINKLILGVIVVSILLLSTFFVTAYVINQDTKKVVDSDSGTSQALRLVNSDEDSENDVSEIEEDSDEQEDVAITGSALEKASAVALKYTGEGKVTDTEIGDEEGYYEIEVTMNNGQEVDVHLDKNFNVLSEEREDENEDEED